ncbi:MAG: hypothetical protein ACR2IF_02640 [Terriglobales bacterium]
MFEKILQLLSLTCRHKRTSQPFAAAATSASVATAQWESVGAGPSHYLVCLDCGKKIPYDWANMRRM